MKPPFKLDSEDWKVLAGAASVFAMLTALAFSYSAIVGIVVALWSIISIAIGFGFGAFMNGCKFDDRDD